MILLIGGTGNIGGEVARILGEKGVAFKVLARDKSKASALLGVNVEIVRGDLSQPETVSAAMEGVEKLFLVTPLHLDQIFKRQSKRA